MEAENLPLVCQEKEGDDWQLMQIVHHRFPKASSPAMLLITQTPTGVKSLHLSACEVFLETSPHTLTLVTELSWAYPPLCTCVWLYVQIKLILMLFYALLHTQKQMVRWNIPSN